MLKRFSLESSAETFFYRSLITPLLRRLSHVEELRLRMNFTRGEENQFIDGHLVHDEIVAYLPRLNRFQFSLYTLLLNVNVPIGIPSNDDVQRSFVENGLGPIGSFVDCHPVQNKGICHVYSLPFPFDVFNCVNSGYNRSNDFSRVTSLVMFGYAPFEHELFANIADDFPNIVKLALYHLSAQKLKSQTRAIDDVPLITFPRLKKLTLITAHIDYLEQFLFDRITRSPRLHELKVCFADLVTITDNFTNDAARRNCSQVVRFLTEESVARPASFFAYFPRL